jgi:hypothetical protein
MWRRSLAIAVGTGVIVYSALIAVVPYLYRPVPIANGLVMTLAISALSGVMIGRMGGKRHG